jgi:hypothetical protein
MNTNTTKNPVITKVIEVPCRKAGIIKSLFEFSLQQNFRYNEKKFGPLEFVVTGFYCISIFLIFYPKRTKINTIVNTIYICLLNKKKYIKQIRNV